MLLSPRLFRGIKNNFAIHNRRKEKKTAKKISLCRLIFLYMESYINLISSISNCIVFSPLKTLYWGKYTISALYDNVNSSSADKGLPFLRSIFSAISDTEKDIHEILFLLSLTSNFNIFFRFPANVNPDTDTFEVEKSGLRLPFPKGSSLSKSWINWSVICSRLIFWSINIWGKMSVSVKVVSLLSVMRSRSS